MAASFYDEADVENLAKTLTVFSPEWMLSPSNERRKCSASTRDRPLLQCQDLRRLRAMRAAPNNTQIDNITI